jgi:hypothetical protein
MENKFNKLFAVFVLAAILSTIVYIAQPNETGDDIQISYGTALYAINVSDDRELIGASTDAFIGKVIEQVGNSTEPYVRTHFSVEVLETIKGDVSGKVIVNQKGGFQTINDDTFLLLTEGDELLQPGETYFFCTKGNDERGYTFIPVYGNILIKTEEDYQNTMKRFQKALAEEIPEKLPDKREQQE